MNGDIAKSAEKTAANANKLWIHCNGCFAHYVDRRVILFLLACQHVICEKCVVASVGRTPGDAPTYMCPLCRKKVRGRQVNNALPTNLKDMFHPEPWRDGLSHDVIDTFQREHRKKLEDNIAKKTRETQKLSNDMQLAHKICQKHYLEVHRNRIMRKQLEYRARQIKYQVKIKREAAHRSLIKRQRSQSAQSISSASTSKSHKYSRSRPGSGAPGNTAAVSLFPQPETKVALNHSAITSFVHHHNHSFVL